MRGADLLMRSLAECGVEICFANPGTSEMHLVAALDAAPGIRPVLTLQENVASGAADGWGRMMGRPASTLLHLGSGLSNALSNLQNARRAATPIVNIVGDHASYHLANDPPLASDIAALAGVMSAWVHTVPSALQGAAAAVAAVDAANGPPGAIATLIVPADVAWSQVDEADAATAWQATRTPGNSRLGASLPNDASVRASAGRRSSTNGADGAVVERVARALASGESAVILVGGRALRDVELADAARVAAATGARLACPTFTARARRGAGSVSVERLPYFPELVAQWFAGVRHLILVDAPLPVAFFAYPGQSTALLPADCAVHTLATGADDIPAVLDALVTATGASRVEVPRVPLAPMGLPSGPLTPLAVAQTVAALLPAEAIVCDEAITNRFPCLAATVGALPHDWCCLTGGSLGMGMPLSLGAALAAPGRRVLNLQADGSAMYAPQALWSFAREGVDVTTVMLVNRRYRVLDVELQRLQLTGLVRGQSLTDLAVPPIDYVQLARSMGVPASRVDSAEGLARAMSRAFAEPGPQVVEAVMVE